MKYETPMVDFLLLSDDIIVTSAQTGLGLDSNNGSSDNTDWGDISNW